MKAGRSNKRWMVGALLFISLLLFTVVNSTPAQEIRRVSMDFQQAPLRDILKIFSQQAGLNFVASREIEGKKITLYLDSVDVQDALASIMKANNLAYEQAPGSSVFIVKESGVSAINMLTKVYTLSFARVSAGSKDKDSGKKGGSSNILKVVQSLMTKDSKGALVGNIVVDKRTNSLVVTSIPEDFVKIEDAIKQLDTATPQALIEAEIVEIKTSALKNLGLTWGNQTDGTFVSFTGPSKKTHFPFIREGGAFKKSLLKMATSAGQLGTLSLQEFSVVLKALETENEARYLAKPRVMVLNNETAVIKISSDSAIGIKSTSQSDTGTLVSEAERMETGIVLKVTPTINKSNYITMSLEPSVSRPVLSNIPGFYDPATRNVKTTVMLKDGQSIAIGGLLKSDKTDGVSKVPGLSRIPFLGRLFRDDDFDSETTEIIIFVTAHVIRDVAGLGREEAVTYPTAADLAKAGEPISSEAPVAEQSALSEALAAEQASAEALATEASPEEETVTPAELEEPEEKVPPSREDEINKTVVRLRKKRELSR